MKKIYYLATLLMLAAMPVLFTSCDDEPYYWYEDYYGDWYDDYDWYDKPFDYGKSDLVTMAQTLNGTWSGTATNEYTNDDGQRERMECADIGPIHGIQLLSQEGRIFRISRNLLRK